MLLVLVLVFFFSFLVLLQPFTVSNFVGKMQSEIACAQNHITLVSVWFVESFVQCPNNMSTKDSILTKGVPKPYIKHWTQKIIDKSYYESSPFFFSFFL